MTTRIVFSKSPTGKYGMAYHMGEVADIKESVASQLIEDGYAIDYSGGDKEPGYVFASIDQVKSGENAGKSEKKTTKK